MGKKISCFCRMKMDIEARLIHDCRATTHTDLQIRAHQKGIKVEVIHNASILNAVGACGLQLYRYGEVRQSMLLNLLDESSFLAQACRLLPELMLFCPVLTKARELLPN